ncbi:hypothetical protein ACFLQ8_00330 [Candidatus Auribacterota bacterium]
MLNNVIKTILTIIVAVLFTNPSTYQQVYAKNINSSIKCATNDFLAPESPYTKKKEEKKPKEPYKPLRVKKADEEKYIIKMHRDIFRLNKTLYDASLAKGIAGRKRKALERRIKKGEKGLGKQLKEISAREEAWSKQIENHLVALRGVKKRFPLPAAADSERRKQAREFLKRAVILLESGNIGAAEALIAGAKKRMYKESNELRYNHFSSIPRESAEELMVKGAPFGEDIRTITYQGFGIIIGPDGTVIVPRQHYLKDPRFDMSFLEFQKDKMKDLPSAERQAVHIQVSEMEDHKRVLGVMKAIVDLRNQIIKGGADLSAEQGEAMSRMLILHMLSLNQTGFNGMIKEQTDKMRRSAGPLLSEMGIKGKKRTEFLKKIRSEFSSMQKELVAPEWSLANPMKDNPMLNPEVRAAKLKEFGEKWNDLLREELAGQGIGLDKDKSADLFARWDESLRENLLTNINALITGLDPYGLIKDEFKSHALLHLYMTAELIAEGRADRNALEFLDTAKGFLFRRLQNTKRIRNNVARQAASMREEARRLAERDDDIRKRLAVVEGLMRDERDVEAAKKIVDEIKGKYFRRKLKEPGMQRAEKKLSALSQLLVEMEDQKERIKKAEEKRADLNGAIALREDKVRILEGTDKKLKAEMLAPGRTRLHLTLARKKLGFLIKHARLGGDGEVAAQLELFLKNLPEKVPHKAKKGRGFLNRLKGLSKRIERYLEEDLRQVASTELTIKLIVGLLDVNKQITSVKEEAGQYMDLLNDPGRAKELETELRDNRQAIEEENSTLKQMKARLSRVEKESEKEKEEAQTAFDAIAKKKIYDNIGSIREDLIYKYDDIVLPRKKAKAHAFFDSKRLDTLKVKLKARGVSDESIDKLLVLLEDIKGPAAYEGGQIFTENYLIKLDEKISELSGDKKKSFFMLAREILYHELVHDFLSKDEGLEMIRSKVLTYPRIDELVSAMRERYPAMQTLEMTKEEVAQEAVAKLASMLFEEKISPKQAKKDRFDDELFKLKEHIWKEDAYATITADGEEAKGDQKKQRRVFYMLKAALGKVEQRLTTRAGDELQEEAKAALAETENKVEALLGEIDAERKKADVSRTAALEFIGRYQQIFDYMIKSKKMVNFCKNIFEKYGSEPVLAGLEDREFTLGFDENVRISPDVVAGFRAIADLPDQELGKVLKDRKLGVKMTRKEWRVFLWALYVRSRLDFAEKIVDPAKFPTMEKVEMFRRNGLNAMMFLLPEIVDAADMSFKKMPAIPVVFRSETPVDIGIRRLIEGTGGEETVAGKLMYRVKFDPFIPAGYRSPSMDLPLDVGLEEIWNIAGDKTNVGNAREYVKRLSGVEELVSESLRIMKDTGAPASKRHEAALAVAESAPFENIKDIVDILLEERSPDVRKSLLSALLTMAADGAAQDQTFLENYARLDELVKKEKNIHIKDFFLKVTNILRGAPGTREMLNIFLDDESALIRLRAYLQLSLNKDAGLKDIFEEKAGVIVGSINKAMEEARKMELSTQYLNEAARPQVLEVCGVYAKICAAATMTLKDLYPRLSAEALSEILKHFRPDVRKEVLRRLLDHPGNETVQTMLDVALAQNEMGDVRKEAALALTELLPKLDAGTLAYNLADEKTSNTILYNIKFIPSEEVRQAAIGKISETFPELDKDEMKDLLAHEDPAKWEGPDEDIFVKIRFAAVAVLKDNIETEDDIERLTIISEKDASKDIKREANAAIKELLPGLDHDMLITLLGHGDSIMRRKAVENLANELDGFSASLSKLSKDIEVQEGEYKAETGKVIEAFKERQKVVVSALIEAANNDESTRVREDARYTIFNRLDTLDLDELSVPAKINIMMLEDISDMARQRIANSAWAFDKEEFLDFLKIIPGVKEKEVKERLIDIVKDVYSAVMPEKEDFDDMPVETKISFLVDEEIPEEIRGLIGISKWSFANDQQFLYFLENIPAVKGDDTKITLLMVTEEVAPFFHKSDRANEQLRGLAVLLKDQSTSLRIPLSRILVGVGNEDTLDALEAAMKDGKELAALQEAAAKIEFPMAVKGLTSRSTQMISDKDIERITEIAALLEPEQVSPEVFTQLSVMLKRLIKTHPDKIKGLIDIAFIRRFGVSEELAVEALKQRSLPANMHIVNEYGKLADGKSVQRFFDYDMKTDTIKHRRNKDVVLPRVPGTTVFAMPSEKEAVGTRIKTIDNGIEAALAVDNAA